LARKTDNSKGRETRDEIIARGVRIAGIEGLGSFSIGRLAKEMKMSKSGLWAHFGSKEQLEKALVERAYEIFLNRVLYPARDVSAGIERLWTLCEYWLEFVEERALPGGYFFTGAFFEYAPQDGPMAGRIMEIADEYFTALKTAVNEARNREEIRREADAKHTAFELNSLLIGAQLSHLLEQKDLTNARLAILTKLHSLATDEIPQEVFNSVKDWKKYLEGRGK
jgi:AcrR family transcriptional regulator